VSADSVRIKEALKILRDVLGQDKVIDEEEELYVYGFDATPLYFSKPYAVVRVFSINDVVEVLKIAHDYRIPIIPRGHGTSLTGAVVPISGGIVVDLSPMTKIEIKPEDGVVEAEAGATVAEVDLECNKYGFFLPPDPASAEVATIGGAIAEDSGGMRGARYGTFRNWVLALDVVIPGGKLLKLGAPVYKKRMGYDLMQLFIGSEGTLGIIIKAVLKIIPLPENIARFLVFFDDMENAINTLKDMRFSKINPLTAEFMDLETIQNINEVFKLGLPEHGISLLIDIDGYSDSLTKISERVLKILKENGAVEIIHARNEEEAKTLYAARRAAYPAIARRYKIVFAEDITVPLSKILQTFKEVKNIEKKYGVNIPTFGHIGDGNLHPNICIEERDTEAITRAKEIFEEICEVAIRIGGVVSGEHGIGIQKLTTFKRMLEVHNNLELLEYMRKIKQIFDPHNIMNPGKILG